MLSQSSPSQRVKVVGAVLSAVALVVVGVVLLGDNGHTYVNTLEKAEAVAKFENANVALANLPTESEVHVPEGWQVESDKQFGMEEEDLDEKDGLEQDAVAEDEDIDSPLDVEEDENGYKYVAEMGDNVIVAEDEVEEGKKAVAADRKKCFAGLKKCGFRRRCRRVCKKKCRPYSTRVCKAKKFCKCFCKFYKNLPKARKCVIYKKKTCKPAIRYRCVRNCKKYCKRVPRCYCCPMAHIRRACRRMCKRVAYKTKCGKCRCYRLKCYKWCKFVCKK